MNGGEDRKPRKGQSKTKEGGGVMNFAHQRSDFVLNSNGRFPLLLLGKLDCGFLFREFSLDVCDGTMFRTEKEYRLQRRAREH